MTRSNLRPSKPPRPAAGVSHGILGRLAYSAASSRDLRLDLMRGFAVLAMVVDHLGGASYLRLITGGNTFLVSAAEFFVFISGWVGGMVWGQAVRQDGLPAGVWKIMRRAGILYALTVSITIGFGTFSIYYHLPWATDIANMSWLLFVQNTAMLKQTLPFADILLLYTLLFAAAPIALWLMYSGRTVWLLAAAVLMWLSFQIFSFEIPWQIPGYGFQFAAWQLLFFSAMAIGFHQRALAKRFERVPLVVCFLITVILFAALIAYYQNAAATGSGGETIASSALFLKSALAVGRVGAFAVTFAFIFLGVHLFWKPLKFLTGWLLLPLGQNALAAYTIHVLVVALCAVMIPAAWNASLEISTAVQALGVLAIWYLVQIRFSFEEAKQETEPARRSIRIFDESEESS